MEVIAPVRKVGRPIKYDSEDARLAAKKAQVAAGQARYREKHRDEISRRARERYAAGKAAAILVPAV